MLSSELAVMQAPMLDGLAFDPFAQLDNGWSPAEVSVSGRFVIQALVGQAQTDRLFSSLI